ncbi:MarR family winged helix-turn-helix transcriptional regulator [Geodermatophilus marinus]|uniref:MarR family winged helix-turn-helix transcriptional regulator n=1 Tax=Geodermatophilus sp. LHW52908 TaxID=2303986 RepID=UPI000E3D6E84|nr:MarR family transcriptional regulator [Geodermatophilus sp. LHW52908]RFU20399.1 MarR family transcriptional regulator [Geodermatophilus sp. LHW52908]
MEVLMDGTVLSADVGYLLTRASGALVRATNAALAGFGLRVRSYSALTLACEARDGISQRDLAETLGLDPSQVVLLVDELTDAGLVERRPSEADRRTKLVVPTPAGVAARGRAARAVAGAHDDRLAALSAEERDLLRGLLGRVVDGVLPVVRA